MAAYVAAPTLPVFAADTAVPTDLDTQLAESAYRPMGCT